MCDEQRTPKKNAIDVYRDTPIRYLGYMGLFKKNPILSPYINILRMSCITYIYADAYDKTRGACTPREVLTKAIDVMLFHFGSSIAVPSLLFGSLMTGVAQNISHASALMDMFPVTMFLAIIPLFGKIVDSGTDYAMDTSYRKMVGITHKMHKTKSKEKPKEKIPEPEEETDPCDHELRDRSTKESFILIGIDEKRRFTCFQKRKRKNDESKEIPLIAET